MPRCPSATPVSLARLRSSAARNLDCASSLAAASSRWPAPLPEPAWPSAVARSGESGFFPGLTLPPGSSGPAVLSAMKASRLETGTCAPAPRATAATAHASMPTSSRSSRITCSSTPASRGWDLRLYLVCSHLDLIAGFEVPRSAAVQERQEPVMKTFDPEAAEKPAASSFESEIGETAGWFASPRFEGITRLYSARQVVEQRGTHPHRLHRGENGGRAVPRAAQAALRRAPADHHLRALFTWSGGGAEADGHRGHLPRRLGHLGPGLGDRGPGARPGQLPALPGARRGRADSARPAHGGPEPARSPGPA